MVGVQLNSADLTGANLSEAYLYGTLDGADLSGADLTKAEAPPGTLEKVKSLKGATMPDGTKHK
ncbi:MAG TPA: pentapeptide repeat-containing protein [Ktedonobacteraceae bacterium]|nr:pentapeptide repeat-containing protein [Ktedonobacteraceae bacterium]